MEYIQKNPESTYIGFQNIPIFELSGKLTYTRRKKRSQICNQKHGKYYPTFDLERCVHILLEMLGSYFVLDYREFRYFRYTDLNINKTKLSCENKSRLVDDTH